MHDIRQTTTSPDAEAMISRCAGRTRIASDTTAPAFLSAGRARRCSLQCSQGTGQQRTGTHRHGRHEQRASTSACGRPLTCKQHVTDGPAVPATCPTERSDTDTRGHSRDHGMTMGGVL